jgi:hypothetical protein
MQSDFQNGAHSGYNLRLVRCKSRASRMMKDSGGAKLATFARTKALGQEAAVSFWIRSEQLYMRSNELI